MNIAILGGTFNPIHHGHLFLAEEVRAAFGFDKIFFIPSNIPAHKAVTAAISPADRLAMCRLALEKDDHFVLDDCEIRRGGVSYMIDTLKDVEERYSREGKIGLVIGDDLVGNFPLWKNTSELAETARIIIVHRRHQRRIPALFPHEYFDNKIIPLSSSEIRDRVRRGLPVRFLVPESVVAYIKEKRLYQGGKNLS